MDKITEDHAPKNNGDTKRSSEILPRLLRAKPVYLPGLLNPLDKYYLDQEEPYKSVLLALREIILSQDPSITHELKYGMPFFCYKGRMFCYVWYHKKYDQPYLGLVEGKLFNEDFLVQENRSRMKIMLLDPGKNLPEKKIVKVLRKALNFYERLK